MTESAGSASNSILRVVDLVKDFGGVRAINYCSFDVQRGSITGLIGPNGAGKTTLFNLVSGFTKPTSGAIYFNDMPIQGMAPHQTFQRGLVRTFQIPRELPHMTVLENLMLVPSNQSGENVWANWFMPLRVSRQESEAQRKALEALEFLRLDHLKDEYAGNLSGGQKKLLELGRTLMADPQMILLDEPGAGVNRTLLNSLADNIRDTQREKGITFLIIEHDMDLVMKLCDPVIVMCEGAELATGTPQQIQRDSKVLEAYLGGKQSTVEPA